MALPATPLTLRQSLMGAGVAVADWLILGHVSSPKPSLTGPCSNSGMRGEGLRKIQGAVVGEREIRAAGPTGYMMAVHYCSSPCLFSKNTKKVRLGKAHTDSELQVLGTALLGFESQQVMRTLPSLLCSDANGKAVASHKAGLTHSISVSVGPGCGHQAGPTLSETQQTDPVIPTRATR